MRTADFSSHVASHAGASPAIAERASRAVLAGIGASLGAARSQLVADELPPALAEVLRSAHGTAAAIEERVRALGVDAGQARELVASVCRVLVEELSREALEAVREAVPPALAELLASPAPEATSRPRHGRRASLATGRPGSAHPVAEARDRRAHTDSVTADNPHDATKLSSARGTGQERRHETLAEGHPGAPRPISRTHR